MLRLKLQYFGHLMQRVDSLLKMMGGIGGQEEKGMTEDEMAGWHHRLDAYEFGWTLGVGGGQGGLACCNSWGRKESDTTEWLNWTELNWVQDKTFWTLVVQKCGYTKCYWTKCVSPVVLAVKIPPANAGDMRHRFEPQVRKIPWRRAWLSTPISLPGESVHGIPKSWTRLKWLSRHLTVHWQLFTIFKISLWSKIYITWN